MADITIKEYFKERQPINDEIENEIFYKHIETILFEGQAERYIKLYIAHPSDNHWSIGWEVRDGHKKGIVAHKDCTINEITKGDISRLIYGTLKVLQIRLGSVATKTLTSLIVHSILQTENYYNYNARSYGKITL